MFAVCPGRSDLVNTSRISDLLGWQGNKYVFIELIQSTLVYIRSWVARTLVQPHCPCNPSLPTCACHQPACQPTYPILDTRISVRPRPSRSGYPPWNFFQIFEKKYFLFVAKRETGLPWDLQRSSFGLLWTEKQVYNRSTFYFFSMNTKPGHTESGREHILCRSTESP